MVRVSDSSSLYLISVPHLVECDIVLFCPCASLRRDPSVCRLQSAHPGQVHPQGAGQTLALQVPQVRRLSDSAGGQMFLPGRKCLLQGGFLQVSDSSAALISPFFCHSDYNLDYRLGYKCFLRTLSSSWVSMRNKVADSDGMVKCLNLSLFHFLETLKTPTA